MVPGTLQKPIFNNFRAQARKWSQEAYRGPVLPISEPKRGNGSRKLPETHFCAISEPKPGNDPTAQFYPLPSPSQESAPGNLQRPIFTHFRVQAKKWPQKASRGLFSAISEPEPGNSPRTPNSNTNIANLSSNTNITPPSSNAPEFEYEYLDPGFEYENHTPEFEYEYLDPGFDYEYHAPEFEHRDSRSQFVAISEPKPGTGPRKPPQAHFVAMAGNGPRKPAEAQFYPLIIIISIITTTH